MGLQVGIALASNAELWLTEGRRHLGSFGANSHAYSRLSSTKGIYQSIYHMVDTSSSSKPLL